jgi:hypothetical protein
MTREEHLLLRSLVLVILLTNWQIIPVFGGPVHLEAYDASDKSVRVLLLAFLNRVGYPLQVSLKCWSMSRETGMEQPQTPRLLRLTPTWGERLIDLAI